MVSGLIIPYPDRGCITEVNIYEKTSYNPYTAFCF